MNRPMPTPNEPTPNELTATSSEPTPRASTSRASTSRASTPRTLTPSDPTSSHPAPRATVIAGLTLAALLAMLVVIAARWSANPQPRDHVAAAHLGHRINVNHAELDTLCLLRGIGPATARRIIEYRTQHGPFTEIEQLDEVKYIGPVTLDGIREHVKVK